MIVQTQFFFTDVDECAPGTNDCDRNAECTNTEGSFTCNCKPGFTGSGFMCTGMISKG